MRTLVIGLGNPILRDDAAGILAAREVSRRLGPLRKAVEVAELSVGGVALMEAMTGYTRCILIDTVWAEPGRVGQVWLFDAGSLPDTLNTASSHDADLPTALRLGRSLGAVLPADEAIRVVGVGARDVLTFGEALSPAIAAALPEMVSIVIGLLEEVGDY
ncbi:MAG: hydrogenase maturation protease [Anaerolineae bacterium]|nr:hydrogenase maturation protease [Anaerolineae bacterium]